MIQRSTLLFLRIAFLLIIGFNYSAHAQIPGCHPGFDFTMSNNTVSFTDLSWFDVGPANTTWHWDFGDGNTSNDQNPVHTYWNPQDEYIVCLTVTNCAAWPGLCCTETTCDTIRIEGVPTAISNSYETLFSPVVYPNPSSGSFIVSYSLFESSPVSVSVYDLNGRKVVSSEFTAIQPGNHTIEISDEQISAPGMYVLYIMAGQRTASIVLNKEEE